MRHAATGEPADRERESAGRPAFSRILLVVLLTVLVLLGLRGAALAPHWDGPWHTDGTAVGVALELVLAVLLAATLIRGRRAARQPGQQAGAVTRLRGWLRFLLSAGMIAVAVILLINAHLHLFTRRPPLRSQPPAGLPSARPTGAPGVSHLPPGGPAASMAPLLYGLLIVVFVAVLALSLRWALRKRPPLPGLPPGDIGDDAADLQEAVTSGRAGATAPSPGGFSLRGTGAWGGT